MVDISSGMTNARLMEKYELSSRQLGEVLARVLEESKALAGKIADDMRKGMNESQLMAKYHYRPADCGMAFEKLLKRDSSIKHSLTGGCLHTCTEPTVLKD